MKVIGVPDLNLEECLGTIEHEGVIITRNGRPVAVLVGTQGMDLEQLQLAHSAKFWALIKERRQQKTLTRAELERLLADE